MVVGINDNSARKKLLQTSNLTLGQCVDICRSSQTSARQLKEINQEDVRLVKDDRKKPVDKKKTKVPEKNQNESQERKCKFCSRYHPFTKKNCPAWGTSCKNCGKLTILQCVAENLRRKCCMWITHWKMRSMNMWPRLK